MDLTDFWDDSNKRRGVTPALVAKAELTLGYKLPDSYVAVLRTKNGGAPRRTYFPASGLDGSGVHISRIYGLGGKWGIDSHSHGTHFWIKEWGYPEIGIVVCECTSAGHDGVMLDYSQCGPSGEPRVVHVDVEVADEPRVTLLAKDFGTFVRGLVGADADSTAAADLARDWSLVRAGRFGPLLQEVCARMADLPDVEQILRNVAAKKAEEFAFAFHADPISYLMYDLLFYLYTNAYAVQSAEEYLEVYPKMLVFPDGDSSEFATGGYAPSFVQAWLEARLAARAIEGVRTKQLRFTDAFVQSLMARALQFRAPT